MRGAESAADSSRLTMVVCELPYSFTKLFFKAPAGVVISSR